MDKINETTQL